jgi:hypothetical protein
MTPRDALLVALMANAAWALVLIVALLRGYSITVILARDRDRR